MTKINTFDFIKENTNIVEIAEFYGMKVDKYRKTICIFHDDHHPSMQFSKNGKYFKCYACQAWGSAVDLVAKLLDVKPFEAVKQINADFNLGLDFSQDEYSIHISDEVKQIHEGLKIWCSQRAEWYEKQLAEYMEYFKSFKSTEEKTIDGLCAEAMEFIEMVQKRLNILKGNDIMEQLALFKLEGGDANG